MIDILIGACWTLICILVGGLITLVLLAVLGDRPEPPEDDDPEWEPLWPDDGQEPIDPMDIRLALYQFDIHAMRPFESNLLEQR